MVLSSGTTDDRYRPTRRDVVTAVAAEALPVNPIAVSGPIHERQGGNVDMAQTVETLLLENLNGVFSEPDAAKRHKAITRLWAEDGAFIDHKARHEGHSGIALAADGLAKEFPNFVFTERGEIQALSRRRQAQLGIRSRWGGSRYYWHRCARGKG